MGWYQSAGQLGEKFTEEAHEAGPQKGKITCVTPSNPCAEWADFYMPAQQFTHYGQGENDLVKRLQIRSIDMPPRLTAKNIKAYSLHSILTFFFINGHKCHQQFVAETEGKDE